MSSWKRDFASGLIVVTPILVIIFVATWLYDALAQLPFIPTIGPEDPPANVAPFYDFAEVMIALVVFVLIVFSAGYLMRTTAGRLAEGMLDDLINRVPGLRVIYNASKLAVETALSGTDDLQKPVKITPWNGMRLTAFKTGQTTDDGREVLFMPTAPNITSGFVIEVKPDDVIETDEGVEEALTRVLSAGFGEGDSPSGRDVTDIPVEDLGKSPSKTDSGANADSDDD
ncbi:DUF502 domain-containing protein [Candidatus Halobonum tyrrellensis]|uniref:DUF502 domain-containing protein n=1 Tax=Candidatus Halobonum tyrrellensis G22 TaxID=1324957 RepID=V4GVU1_9EURY|nr:DUF502 domain-containing protein [Candidatus Halobonum tyrrellensis]ESP89276.1 hypothetical protein K933_04641 [Candidatus Halobonum tyrrellensis G22]